MLYLGIALFVVGMVGSFLLGVSKFDKKLEMRWFDIIPALLSSGGIWILFYKEHWQVVTIGVMAAYLVSMFLFFTGRYVGKKIEESLG